MLKVKTPDDFLSNCLPHTRYFVDDLGNDSMTGIEVAQRNTTPRIFASVNTTDYVEI